MEDLVESILDYIRADYTDYAIMINGEWGSGKTYFWNNKVRSKIETTEINGKRYRTIYMSLYGISNLDDISKKIFMEMNPNLLQYFDILWMRDDEEKHKIIEELSKTNNNTMQKKLNM